MGDNMSKVAIFLIDLYQALPLRTHAYCRCIPTCSEYTKEAILECGFLKGSYLGIKRILQCRPHGIYGYQPFKKNEEE